MKKISFLFVLFLLALPLCASADVLKGDVDGDGEIGISDVSTLIESLLSFDATSISLEHADVDNNGEVDIIDVARLIDILLTMPSASQVETFTVNDVSFKMITVSGGTFTMGATPEQGIPDNVNFSFCYPTHQVTLSSFSIGETEVTQALWQAVMGNNPSYFADDLNRPVEQVSWNVCQAFITKLNEMTGRTFRLPTEAEWEFAARGGVKSKGYRYSGSDDLNAVGWYDGNCMGSTQPVAMLAPNELGLYDMTGNVQEFCQDWFDMNYYSVSPSTNPTGPDYGDVRVKRGGCIWDGAYGYMFVVAMRNYSLPSYSFRHTGLRIAL